MKKQATIKFPFSIRIKVILPYLILTLGVAVVGAYVVTKLVANSLNERLTNQLLEAGRVVSDTIVRQEISHLEIARIIAYTRGLGDALSRNDAETIASLALPVAISLDTENLIIINNSGMEILHLLKKSDGTVQKLELDSGAGGLAIVSSMLASTDPDLPPKRAMGYHPVSQRFYYFTAVPVFQNKTIRGVVLVGSSLNSLLPELKNTALADVIFYTQNGQAISTSLSSPGSEKELLEALSIPESTYNEIVSDTETVSGKSINIYSRQYNMAWGPIRVGNDNIGVFSVALPTNFVLQAGTTSRNTYAFFFTLAMMGVIMTGYSIARLITRPLNSLVQTSQAVAGGDLDQRSGIRSRDEIGFLAETFDEMTERLSTRTKELEIAYRALEQMDHTKVSFINVAAHELRSPLTLIKGYTQMLIQKTSEDATLESLAQGILNGSNRLLDIVNSMLDVSRIDSQMLKLIPELIDINTLVERVHQEFEIALRERKLSFASHGLDYLPSIMADPDLLYKVFYHLVMNAIKYTPDGGLIKITGSEIPAVPGEPQKVEICISDTGIGIDPENRDLIFEKFYQTGEVQFHSSGRTKFKGGGPGLGLAIVKGIVLAHGGQISINSPGHDEDKLPGSQFIIVLPLDYSQDVKANDE